MRRRGQFLGMCSPVPGWLHATPAWVKFVVLAGLMMVLMLLRHPVVNTGILVGAVALGVTGRMRLRQVLVPLARMWIILVIFGGVQVVFNTWWGACTVMSIMATGVVLANVFMLSTPLSELLELFRVLVSPVKLVGGNPHVIALAAAITVRSVPYLADLADVAKEAASARGLERSVRARTVPVMLGAVKYAQDTGRALDARGILD